MQDKVNDGLEPYFEILGELLEKSKDENNLRGDRTGTGTYSVFGRKMEFDLSQGFPILGERYTWFKGIKEELLWFLKGDTNVRALENQGVKIWSAWADERGDLGPIYGRNLRRLPVHDCKEPVLLDVREGPAPGPLDTSDVPNPPPPDFGPGPMTGEVRLNTQGLEFEILNRSNARGSGTSRYGVRFTVSGYMTTCQAGCIILGKVKDRFDPNIHGVGTIGTATRPKDRGKSRSLHTRAKRMWEHMLGRCYDTDNKQYSGYGGRGVYVSPRWLVFSSFLSDLSRLPNYEEFVRAPSDYALDKDYYGSKCYDVSTCVFLHKSANTGLANARNVQTVVKGGTRTWTMVKDAAAAYGCCKTQLYSQLDGVRTRYPEIEIRDYVPPEGKLLRHARFKDQLADVIKSIRENPDSRRHVISLWEVADLSRMALPPCHGVVIQFYVNPLTDTLDVMMYQRSADTLLGLPFNIASYALLTQIIAHVCNLKPGTLHHVLGDTHLYANHLGPAEELMRRRRDCDLSPPTDGGRPYVTLDLEERYETTADAIRAVNNLTSDDIALHDYKHLSKIPAPVAV